MKVLDKIALGALTVIFITNPASGQVILDGLDVIFKLIFQYGSPINFIASAVLVVYVLSRVLKREVVNIPKKTTKNKRDGLKYEAV